MAEDLSTLWKNFTLSEEESLIVETSNQLAPGSEDRGKACLIEKLFTDRTIG